jgi:small subunit ribosomal protein S17
MKKKENNEKEVEEKASHSTSHGSRSSQGINVISGKRRVSVRGRIFQGEVKKKFRKRIVIEFERPFFVKKYERYLKSKTKVHAHLPDEMYDEIHLGDLVQIGECRPISKIIHFVVIKKIRGSDVKDKENGETK